MKKRIILPVFLVVILGMIAGGLWGYNLMVQKKQIQNEIDRDWEKNIGQEESEYLQEISKKTTYSIRNITKEGNIFLVEVKVKGVDLGAKLDEIGLDNLPQSKKKEEIEKFLKDIVKNTYPVETTADIMVEMNEDGSRIIYSEEFIDAMSGKVYSYALRVMDKLMQENEE